MISARRYAGRAEDSTTPVFAVRDGIEDNYRQKRALCSIRKETDRTILLGLSPALAFTSAMARQAHRCIARRLKTGEAQRNAKRGGDLEVIEAKKTKKIFNRINSKSIVEIKRSVTATQKRDLGTFFGSSVFNSGFYQTSGNPDLPVPRQSEFSFHPLSRFPHPTFDRHNRQSTVGDVSSEKTLNVYSTLLMIV